jgi:hypothetical protein
VKVALDGVAVTVTVAACMVKAKAPQNRNILFIFLTTGLIDQMRGGMSGGFLSRRLPFVS